MPDKRPVTTNDAQLLADIYASTRADEVAAWGWDPQQQAAFLHMQGEMQRRAHAMQYLGATHEIILHDGAPAGQILVHRTPAEIRLVDIAFLPAYRGRGLGTAAIAELQREAAVANLPVTLSVLKSNPAQRLYARLGFIRTGESDTRYTMQWQPRNPEVIACPPN
ncbi:MAG TPA: GNAT family N-acetyltransferase [Symbiobacteriaceae bacterium]|nr:GNAT family N-acetyltransferase [Symbiobacteriaceae bacterium]